jgi:hypothetical protein
MMRRVFAWLFILTGAGQLPAAVIGQIDTFEDGTTMGWLVPGASPNPPSNVSTGGPSGSGDAYLSLVATGGSGAGSRLAVLNEDQWAENYTAAGIVRIRMDVNNFGPADVYLRLLFEDFDRPGPPVNLALSTDAVFVPAGSGWTNVEFAVTPGALTALIGTSEAALADTNTLRLFHNPDPDFPGPNIGIPVVNVSLGVDNITALGVPEPRTLFLLACGLAALALRLFSRAG